MRASRIMKFVAEVSSSMRSAVAPVSMDSMRVAACEVDPLALVVEKDRVSVPEGSPVMKGEMSTEATDRPSSARIAVASRRARTHSRPSPAMWG